MNDSKAVIHPTCSSNMCMQAHMGACIQVQHSGTVFIPDSTKLNLHTMNETIFEK